jgi:hypothetical protein
MEFPLPKVSQIIPLLTTGGPGSNPQPLSSSGFGQDERLENHTARVPWDPQRRVLGAPRVYPEAMIDPHGSEFRQWSPPGHLAVREWSIDVGVGGADIFLSRCSLTLITAIISFLRAAWFCI